MRFSSLIILMGILLSVPSLAQEAPVPKGQEERLESLTTALEEKKKAALELERKAKGLNSELETTRSKLVDAARSIKEHESHVIELETRMAGLSEERNEIEIRLQRDKGSLGSLVLALERIRRIPPEALMLKPGAPLQTAQSAMLLKTILPQIYNRAENLKKDADRLAVLLEQLEKDKSDLEIRSLNLARDYKSMEQLLRDREIAYSETIKGQKERQGEVLAISRQAETVKDLIARLEEEKMKRKEREEREEEIERENNQNKSSTVAARAFEYRQPERLPSLGQGQLPISGLVRVGFGQTDDIGAQSQGITMEGRAGGIVVAPMAGKVQFSGPFRNYGQLIIIEHEKDYHSLIAGMDRIDIVVEQVINAGEPIGHLPRSGENGGKPSLYYELRHKGQPVDPAKKIANLKS